MTQTAEQRPRMPTYVDMDRLCFELSITERTADAWVKQGILPPPIQPGGKRLWPWKKVQAYLEGGKPKVAPSDDRAEGIRNATRQAITHA